ncbi:glycosyltransferase [bacterium]|jgi:glycosyltransferase involved in cell wall biosynthesis|nr:glycosyltransferase [bacterium]
MPDRKKIVFTIPNMEGGGAERTVSNLLKYLDRSKYRFFLVLYEKKIKYDIPVDVKVFSLNVSPSGNFFVKIYNYAIRIIKLAAVFRDIKPDTIMSFLTDVNISAILARFLSFSKSRLILSERNSVKAVYSAGYQRTKRFLVRLLYRYADGIVTVSEDISGELMGYGIDKGKITVIHNMVDCRDIAVLSKEEVTETDIFNRSLPVIVTAGSLTRQKNYSLLLDAFKLVLDSIDAKLIILGEGPLLGELKEQAKTLCVEDDVVFAGFQKNPFKYISKSDVFVVTSLWEGFPNVILEAFACGTPVICVDCGNICRGLIKDEINGFIVSGHDDKLLAASIIRLLENSVLLKEFAGGAVVAAGEYDIKKGTSRYEKVIFEK